MLALAFALALSAAPTAVGPTTAAQSAFDRGEFAEALEQLAPLVTSLPPGEELGRVHLLRAQCFHALRQASQTETALTLALMADPEARLDSNRVSPELAQTLTALSLRLSGRLVLQPKALQPGDLVKLDGEVVGPSTRTVSIGRHAVVVEREGKPVLETPVLVRPGQELVFDAAVPAATAPAKSEAPPVVEAKRDDDERGPIAVLARARLDVQRPGVSFDFGLELHVSRFRIAATALVGKFFGATLRPSMVLLETKRLALSLFAEGDVFVSTPVAFSIGGGGALDVRLVAGLEVFVEAGGFYAPITPPGVRSGYFLLGAGARYRF